MGNITYGDTGDTTKKALGATTETLVSTVTMLPSGMYTIKKIRIAFHSVTASEVPGGFLELKIDKVSGPFKFAYGYATDDACAGLANAEEIDVNIPVPGGAQVKIYVTNMTDGDMTCSIIYV